MKDTHHENSVFLDISIKTIYQDQENTQDQNNIQDEPIWKEDIEYIGRIEITLHWNIAPITCENFYRIIEGNYESKTLPGQKLHYKNTLFHHITPGWCIQGGDVIRNDGTGGETIYGPKISEETFYYKFNKPYRVAMAGYGSSSVTSQFFFNLKEAPVLDGFHVIFGDVSEGMDILNTIDALASRGLENMQYIYISDCGPLFADHKAQTPRKTSK